MSAALERAHEFADMSELLQAQCTRRAMGVHDLDAVMALEAGSYAFPWTRGNFIDSLAAGYVAEVLCHDDGALVGYFVAMPGAGEMHLLNITVAPRLRRCGLARLMLDTVLQHALDRDMATLWLEVRASNKAARHLYERSGFVEVALRCAYYPGVQGREDAVVMRRRVGGEAGHGLD